MNENLPDFESSPVENWYNFADTHLPLVIKAVLGQRDPEKVEMGNLEGVKFRPSGDIFESTIKGQLNKEDYRVEVKVSLRTGISYRLTASMRVPNPRAEYPAIDNIIVTVFAEFGEGINLAIFFRELVIDKESQDAFLQSKIQLLDENGNRFLASPDDEKNIERVAKALSYARIAVNGLQECFPIPGEE